MIKTFFAFLLFCSGVGAYAESGIPKGGQFVEVHVRKDEFNPAIPEGMFAVRGMVRDMYTYVPVDSAFVTNAAEAPFAMTDSLGFFTALFPLSDTAIYCYKPGLNEVVLKGPFTDRHLIEVDFYLSGPYIIQMCAKPVIYAYDAPGDFSVRLRPHGGFSFTYPAYSGEWQMRTGKNGLTDIRTGRTYPYLFWEGPGRNLDFIVHQDSVAGYLIRTDTCIAFLESTLSGLGLNEREATDFITFWGPQLMVKDYALVQFLDAGQYAMHIAELSVSPQPDAVLRLYMYFMLLDEPATDYAVVAPPGQKFERKGFTVVEWGGSELQPERLAD